MAHVVSQLGLHTNAVWALVTLSSLRTDAEERNTLLLSSIPKLDEAGVSRLRSVAESQDAGAFDAGHWLLFEASGPCGDGTQTEIASQPPALTCTAMCRLHQRPPRLSR
jgi:hypothetical protein